MNGPRPTPRANARRAGAAVVLATIALAGLAGCGVYRKLVGEDTVSLEGADVVRMDVDIRRPVKTMSGQTGTRPHSPSSRDYVLFERTLHVPFPGGALLAW